jgi:sugar O-acyltransferase (sialic acid O-acetyltransferase NeuD family)
MTVESVVVVGAGGFGRKVLDALEAVNAVQGARRYDILGILDDAPSQVNLERLAARGIRYLGTTGDWLAAPGAASYIAGLGFPETRRRVVGQFKQRGIPSASVVHPLAGIGSQVRIGVGVVILPGVQVSTNVAIGDHVHLNANATIGHDAVLEDYVSVNPGGIVSGDCLIREGAMLGAGSVVLQGRVVGLGSVVGAAACVVRDVPDAVTVTGVPAAELERRPASPGLPGPVAGDIKGKASGKS